MAPGQCCSHVTAPDGSARGGTAGHAGGCERADAVEIVSGVKIIKLCCKGQREQRVLYIPVTLNVIKNFDRGQRQACACGGGWILAVCAGLESVLGRVPPPSKTGPQGALTLNSDVLMCQVLNAYPMGFFVFTLKAEPLWAG